MERPEAISNSGPLIHLAEIGGRGVLAVFSGVFIPPEVLEEVGLSLGHNPSYEEATNPQTASDTIAMVPNLKVEPLVAQAKDYAKILMEKYEVHLGEACAMALAKQKGLTLFLTDDLAARATAKEIGLEPHGTVGIILRAYRTGVLTKKTAVKWINAIQEKSSLFITKDLIAYILNEIEKTR